MRETYQQSKEDVDQQVAGASSDERRCGRREDDGDDDEENVRTADHGCECGWGVWVIESRVVGERGDNVGRVSQLGRRGGAKQAKGLVGGGNRRLWPLSFLTSW
jgi:hypothetical protein